jgi:hypothetical protein
MGWWAPGSDVEDETSAAKVDGSISSRFRGPPDGPMFLFSVGSGDGHEVPVASGDYVYESVMVLWLRAWLDQVEATLTEPLDTSSMTGRQLATFPIPEYDLAVAMDVTIFAFFAHIDILLPLCLKSLVLRYSVEVLPMYPSSTKVMVDDSHMLVLDPFVEMLARGMMGLAFSGLGSTNERDKGLVRALSSSEVVLRFLVGLLTVLHPEHMHLLIAKYFTTLRHCETEHLGESFAEIEFEWTDESLHRVRCSRQLRLRAIEIFASLPSFLALNFPLKCSGHMISARSEKASWMRQYKEIENSSSSMEPRNVYPDGIERRPPNGWLAKIVIDEGLSVSALSCEAVVAEAMAHVEVSQQVASRNTSTVAPSLKKRPGAALKRGDLLMLQSLAIHAITCVYELVLRRHSMDRRFQTENCRARIAALFAGSIVDMSISNVRWLARMEATHKVRSMWLLCFVYVNQEAPEPMIRGYIRSFCDPKVSRDAWSVVSN